MTGRRLVRDIVPGLYAVQVRGSQIFLAVGDAITIVDTGARGSGGAILAAIAELDGEPREVACIAITHAHADHVGGLPEVQRAIDAPTVAHEADAGAIMSLEPLPNPFRHRSLALVSAPLLRRIDPGPALVELPVRDGDALPGPGDAHVVHLPGHTPGSIAVHFRAWRTLVVGDAMELRRGRLAPPSRYFTRDMRQARESIRKLARLDFDTLCLSHFPPIVDGAAEAVLTLAATLED